MVWTPEALEGTTLANRYRIDRLIGKGGMGAVYSAEQLGLGRRVAVKVLNPILAEDEVHLRRFEREAQSAASLGHANVVQVTDLCIDSNGLALLVMELLDGRSLLSLIGEGPLTVRRAVTIATQVTSALEAAHAVGIVHRDIKPANVMVVSLEGIGEVVKVLDFGIAKLREGPGFTRLTQTGAAVGTPSYMSPEQARGDAVDARADVYAVGALLFTCLVGRPPFVGKDMAEQLLKIVEGPRPHLPDHRADVPAALDDLVRRCMARDRDDRPASATELLAGLRAVQGAAEEPQEAPLQTTQTPAADEVKAISQATDPTSLEVPSPSSPLAGETLPSALAPPTTAPVAGDFAPPHPSRAGPPRGWVLPLALGLGLGVPLVVGLGLLVAVAASSPSDEGTLGGLGALSAGPPSISQPLAAPVRGEAVGVSIEGPLIGSVEQGSLFCEGGTTTIVVTDRVIQPPSEAGMIVAGCNATFRRCTVQGGTNAFTTMNGATVVIEDSRVEASNGAVMGTGGGTVQIRNSTLSGGNIGIYASSDAVVLVHGGTVRGGYSSAMASSGGRVELHGVQLDGPIMEAGGSIVQR